MAKTEDRRDLTRNGEWRRELYEASPERQGELFSTISGLENEPLYTAEDVEVDHDRDLGYPGEFPFTRGVYPSMYRGRLWTMRQFAGFGTAEETNERFQLPARARADRPLDRLRHADADGLRLRSRALARRGRARGRRDRLARRHGDALRRHPARRGLHVDDDQRPGRDAARVLHRRRRAAGRPARGAPGHDPERHPQGVHRAEGVDLPARARRMRLIDGHGASSARRSCRAGTRSRSPATTSARPARPPCRSSPSRSPNGFAYVDAAIARGLDVDDFAPRLSFFFNAHIDFFEEIAKFRAARRIWARELRERYGAKNPRSWLMRFHTQTAGVSLTAQQPENNIVRIALQALAAVLGGTQSLHTNSFDEALALPTENAVADRAPHAAGDRPRDRRGEHDRSARRLLLRRGPHRPARGARPTTTSTGSRSSAASSRRSRRTSSSARSPRRRSATRPRSRRSSGSSSASTATSSRTSPSSSSCASTRRSSSSRSSAWALRGRRDGAKVEAALARLKEGAAARGRQPDALARRRCARLRHSRRDV